MANPLVVFPLMFRASRPSRARDMRAISCPFWIWKGYEALMFFGTIITHSQTEADRFNARWDALKNHEMIHLYQARTTHDSWLCFYVRYLYYWFRALFHRRCMKNAAYLLNPFEMEAYGHMYELDYLERHEATEWKKYAALPVEERHRIWLTAISRRKAPTAGG